MAYGRYRYRRQAKAAPRDMMLKYAGRCACCGAELKAGQWATYYPPGTIAGRTDGAVAHVGGLEGTSQACYAEMCRTMRDRGEASTLYPNVAAKPEHDPGYVDLDKAYEDACSDICGR